MAFVDGEARLRHPLIVFDVFQTYSFADGEASTRHGGPADFGPGRASDDPGAPALAAFRTSACIATMVGIG
jgi:hypothetical protein